MHQGAHFVIDQTLIELLSRSDVIGCVRAMIEAEIARLPVETLTIEFEFDGVRRFVLLKETPRGIVAHVASLTKEALEVTFRQTHVQTCTIRSACSWRAIARRWTACAPASPRRSPC